LHHLKFGVVCERLNKFGFTDVLASKNKVKRHVLNMKTH